jgi:acetyltransferase-like isoleucine patch superfamily enzyme
LVLNLKLIVQNKIGLRTIYKSLRANSAATNYRQLGRTLIDGKTKLFIEKSASIVNNNGYLHVGMNSSGFLPTANPSMLLMESNSRLIINGSVFVAKGVLIQTKQNAVLELGDNVAVNSNTTILCTNKIKIGDRTGIGWDVEICDSAFHSICEDPNIKSPIEIGSNVLICSHSRIMKGVKIGNGSVIASGAIVTKDVPACTLAGGIPARVIKQDIKWKQ